MTKRIIALLFAVVLLASAALIPACAADEYIVRIDDSADLLSPAEEDNLLATMKEVSESCKCNVLFVTVNDLNDATFSFNGTTADFADVYYEKVCGMNTDGFLFLTTLKNPSGKREFYISTSGKCIKGLSDSERESVFDDLQYNHHPDSKGYYDMFNAAATDLKGAIIPHLKWYSLPLAVVIGFVIALIIMLSLKKKLQSVAFEHGAKNYVRAGSMNVTASRDTYLYSTVSRTAKPKDTGSSSHTSSGGGSHGGGGRSF